MHIRHAGRFMSAMTTTKSNVFHLLLGLALLAGVLSCGGQPPQEQDEGRSAAAATLAATYAFTCPSPPGFNGAVALVPVPGFLPFIPMTSLAAVENPAFAADPVTGGPTRTLRGDLTFWIADQTAAIQLGKALFWDIQAGSDNKTTCATCHFQAGADVRTKNQLNPGANGTFDGKSTNHTLVAADFPFVDPTTGKNVDNISGSQGVRASNFVTIDPAGNEVTTPVTDATFGTMRQSTGLNTPSTVNAVFNHRNFFNGRAQPEFNGVNPWGARDANARVWTVLDFALGNVGQIKISVQDASLASQSVGPPLNPVEMSALGRSFPDLGRKLLRRKPLGLQAVSSKDSVLGALADRRGKGLKTTYAALIQQAFKPQWWSGTDPIAISTPTGTRTYSQMEANFSLYWGLSVMLYMGTLVSDHTPMDQYLASRAFDVAGGTGRLLGDNPALLDQAVTRLASQGITIPLAGGGSRAVTRDDILLGIDLFEKPLPLPGTPLPGDPAELQSLSWRSMGVGCAFCHIGAETTSASVRNLTVGVDPLDARLGDFGFDIRMERMFMGVRTPPPTPPQPPPPVPLGTDVVTYDSGTYAVTVTDIDGSPVTPLQVPVNSYDSGWYNIGVRPTAENVGIGGFDPFGKPLSWVEYFLATMADPSTKKIPGGGLVCLDVNGNPVVPPAAPLGSVFAGEVLNPDTGYPLLSGGLLRGEATDVQGSFKTLSLRNVELNGPYFHTGGKSTLRQVIEFYDQGGNFQNASLSPLIRPLGLTPDQANALIAFLLALTDDRVIYQRAPFDHPELPLPAGQDAAGNDLVTTLPAVGAGGLATPVARYLGLNPFQP